MPSVVHVFLLVAGDWQGGQQIPFEGITSPQKVSTHHGYQGNPVNTLVKKDQAMNRQRHTYRETYTETVETAP